MAEQPGRRPPRPSHPKWPAVLLLVAVSALLLALAVLSTFGRL